MVLFSTTYKSKAQGNEAHSLKIKRYLLSPDGKASKCTSEYSTKIRDVPKSLTAKNGTIILLRQQRWTIEKKTTFFVEVWEAHSSG